MQAVEEQRTESMHAAPTRTVLLVEDETPLRTIIARNLEQRGYRLAVAVSVRDALLQMSATFPDVIILDINLPDGTGWEILRWLRSSDRHPAVIVYSAVPPSRKRVAEFRPDAVLLKPFPMDCLLDLVETVGTTDRQADQVPETRV
jgi:DNA-binding response OmpR family regulator